MFIFQYSGNITRCAAWGVMRRESKTKRNRNQVKGGPQRAPMNVWEASGNQETSAREPKLNTAPILGKASRGERENTM